ncbi:MAG TPA: sensor domain-containing diguanylate cyclase [Rhodopila sp.]|uniref:sensor domain-containing diguanylate cyclase n=1 Tax=Rhodopila sp. TaxID=2480087 RepID=UPI002BFAE6BB|nr:sensor domain-containing diguanylate cyclase [Rhodopila sp.]HVY15686.1 sensor domain-containing diguanylate cyclase [Rhodopila sp.]
MPRTTAVSIPDGLSAGSVPHATPRRRRQPGSVLASAVLEHLPIAVIVLDSQLRLRHWNRQAVTLLDAPSVLSEAAPSLDDMLSQARALSRSHREAIGRFCREQIPGDGLEADSVMRLTYGRDGHLLLRLRSITNQRWLLLIDDQPPTLMFDGPDTWLDALTGLSNRRGFHTALEDGLTLAGAEGHFCVMLIDIDHFTAVNDTYGRPTGDALLCLVARRLRSEVRGGDLLGRHGGDSFVVLARDTMTAEPLAARILHALAMPFQIEGEAISITASIGLAYYPVAGTQADALLRAAEIAVGGAKRAGRGRWMTLEDVADPLPEIAAPRSVGA